MKRNHTLLCPKKKRKHEIISFRSGFDVINPLLTDSGNNLCYIRRMLLLSIDIQISKYHKALRKISGAGKKKKQTKKTCIK